MKKINFFIVVLASIAFLSLAFNVSADEKKEDNQKEVKTISISKLYDQFVEQGLTCEIQKILITLDRKQHTDLIERAYKDLSREEIQSIINTRDRGCQLLDVQVTDTASLTDELGAEAAIRATGNYVVEFIEEAVGSGGYYPSAIYRDSAAYNWMCNDGSWEYPADYIAEYNVPGAYSSRSDLRIRGTHEFASCYIGDSTAARVYEDDGIRACFGYWSVFWCVKPYEPETYESKVWID